MPVLQALWNGSHLHVWAEADWVQNGMPASAETPPGTSAPKPYGHREGAVAGRAAAAISLPADELRSLCGECWDSLLVSSATDSSVTLKLPFLDGRYLSSSSSSRRNLEAPGDAGADRPGQKPVDDGWPRRLGDENAGETPVPHTPPQGASLASAPIRLQSCRVETLCFSPADAIDLLDSHDWGDGLRSSLPTHQGVGIGTTVQFWSKSAALVLELLAGQRFVPVVRRDVGESALESANSPEEVHNGRWLVATLDLATADRVRKLTESIPTACKAFDAVGEIRAADLMESFLLTTGDAVVRRCLHGDELAQAVHDRSAHDPSMLIRWLRSLVAEDSSLAGLPSERKALAERVLGWVGKIVVSDPGRTVRTCLKLIPPTTDAASDTWRLAVFAQSVREPAKTIAAIDLANRGLGPYPGIIPDVFDYALDQIQRDLSTASEQFPMLAALGNSEGRFECNLTTAEAYAFLRDAALVLEAEGFRVWLPDWWKSHAPRIQMRMDIRPKDATPGGEALNLDALVAYDWRIAVGDENITLEELEGLVSEKQPLVRIRGRWAEVQPTELQRAVEFLRERASQETTLLDALRRCFSADEEQTGLPVVGYSASGWISALLDASDTSVQVESVEAPAGFVGSLRPYQLRGLQWLSFLSRVGIGACLADDMGLGKTIQLIALLLHEREANRSPGPTLLVVPMSLVGNWKREIERFGPALKAIVHHGLERRSGQEFIDEAARNDVVISTYALIHRDFEYLSAVQWGRLALDEAQNVKNPAAKQSMAVRALKAHNRVALTGTPVENHLSELWTIMDFLNQGYLGTAADFRRQYAVPIERHRDLVRAGRLRQLIRPFVLRRKKNDPNVQVDLPPKLEMKVFCNLTREQAGLYQAVVGEMLAQIDGSEGMQRRGLILATLVKLKQVCNHPVQLLGDDSSLPQRSGKCERLTDMLDEVLAEGDRALVFTQFREMGRLLQKLLVNRFQREVLFLHGGTTQKDRDAMVERFQSEGIDTPLFILSLKAGGFGLNLTAANHVFHFDRWWNPAVEDQAADRAHRIGQSRQVQVHKFVCIGTLEERIDAMLEQKRSLAESVIGTGESWITELSTEALRDLFALSRDAVADE